MANELKPVYRCSYFELSPDNTTLYIHNPFEIVGFCTDQAGLDAIIANQGDDYFKRLTICPEMMEITTIIVR
jgi:hypothetical protein